MDQAGQLGRGPLSRKDAFLPGLLASTAPPVHRRWCRESGGQGYILSDHSFALTALQSGLSERAFGGLCSRRQRFEYFVVDY